MYFGGDEMSVSVNPSPEIIKQVNELIVKGFEIPIEKLVATASLGPDLGLDSLDAVDMLVYIEEHMKVKVNGERLKSIRYLQDVYVLAAESLPNVEKLAEVSSQF